MGVKDLWNILSPVCNNVSINNLHEKTIAIDLSCWVCEGQFVGEKVGPVQPRMYMRNVFFRTHALLMINVKPVFVLDGKAPDLKHAAMAQRNNYRFRRFRRNIVDDEQTDNPKKGGRSRFKGILKQCRDMLELMGVTCVESDGEAEALCGQLNRDGLVDGVITQDSDVFLYGAKNVYRNLVIKNGTGTIDAYDMKDIESKLRLTREKMVAMSLLCGCDYEQGVQGVGKEMAYKYLSSCDDNVLEKFRNLRNNLALIKLEEEKNGCVRCCHPGKTSEHKKNGCRDCFMTKGCSENFSPLAYKNLTDEKKKEVNLELNLRRKAVSDPSFPNQETIDEFLLTEQILVDFDATWTQPNLCRFINFSSRMLEWEVEYGLEKIFPVLARWILQRPESLETQQVFPKEIVKKRVLKGVASYELAWGITDPNLTGFLALISETPPETFSSCEPQTLVAEALPDLHKAFVEKGEKKGKKLAVRKLKVKNGEIVSEIDGSAKPVRKVKDKKIVTPVKVDSQAVKKINKKPVTPVDLLASLQEALNLKEAGTCESTCDSISRKRNSSEMKALISPSKTTSIEPQVIELSDSDSEVDDEGTNSPARKKLSPNDSPEKGDFVDIKNEVTVSSIWEKFSQNQSVVWNKFVEIHDEDTASPVRKKFSPNESPEIDDLVDIKNEATVPSVRKKFLQNESAVRNKFVEIHDEDTASPVRKKFYPNDSPELDDIVEIKSISPTRNKFSPNDFVEIPDEDLASPKKYNSPELNHFEDIENKVPSSPAWNNFSPNDSSELKDDVGIPEDIVSPARRRFSLNDSPELNDFEVWQCANVHYEPEELSVNEPVKREEVVNFSLGLESFCNMTIDVSDDESGSDSDISAIIENIMSRKRF